ncbi:MAG: hypothetical protein ACT4O2_01050 [Beijerinckiaceae bacterium]
MKFPAIMGVAIFAAIAISTVAPALAKKRAVTTYHYDNLRTGWNQNETRLTPANVGHTTFGVLAQAALDDQVDAQPLVVPGQQVTAGIYTVTPAPGTYQVVYVATENNTVYGIKASDGTVLLKRNLGPPVPTPLGCKNNGPNVGITSTPVFDVAANALYVVAYTLVSGNPAYHLFALNPNDLTNKISPVTVAASHTLSDGKTTYNFDATYQRQRPGLLLSSGNIYAGFGSFCDLFPSKSRGWVLGWQASTLVPLAANKLTNTLATGNYFLSAIWMSGYGIAAAPGGNLFFSTGNSAPNTYDGVRNIQESVVKIDPQLDNLLGIFTPANENTLDISDNDFGSGGVLVVPKQPGPFSHMLAATSKTGRMFLLNRGSLGGFTPGGPDKVLDKKKIGRCLCGPSFFTGPDGVGRVVSSGASTTASDHAQITVWKIQTSPTVGFVQEGAALPVASGQDGGTFTAVSSNGTQPGTAIIWATGRPTGSGATPTAINLYAFAAAPSSGVLALLYSSQAGTWPNSTSNANIVPVVANGRVFVASNQLLTIFGLGGGPFVPPAAAAAKPAALTAHALPHEITGVLEHAEGEVLTLRTRTGKAALVDDSDARREDRIGVLVPGNAYTAQGTTYDSTGALRARIVTRAKPSPALWPPDR